MVEYEYEEPTAPALLAKLCQDRPAGRKLAIHRDSERYTDHVIGDLQCLAWANHRMHLPLRHSARHSRTRSNLQTERQPSVETAPRQPFSSSATMQTPQYLQSA